MKTVYVLGAGCSYEDGIPLVKDFFPKIVELLESDELKDQQEIENFKKILKFKNALFNDYNIEEFFSIIDFYISMDVNFEPEYDLNSIRAGLIELIAKTIKYSLKNKVIKSSNYEEFYTKIVTRDDTVISLNWDLLLDHVRDGVNYDMTLLQYDINDQTPVSPYFTTDEKIPILKLHGSLNFLGCTDCKARFLYKSEILEILDEKRKCTSFGKGNLKILLMPPTTFKNLNNFEQLKELWNSAFGKLVYCDRIRFVGYSFPTADVEFKHLLKAALNYRKFSDVNSPIIEVYDYKQKNKYRKEFEEHYNQMFDEITNLEEPIKFNYTKFSELVNYCNKKNKTKLKTEL